MRLLCIRRELARFYSFKSDSSARYDPKQHSKSDQQEEDDQDGWKRLVEDLVFGLGRRWLNPPGAMARDMTFAKVADLPDLYKVFERC